MTRTSPYAFSHEGDLSDQEDAFLTACREGAVLCAVCDSGGGVPSRPAADLVITRLREAFDANLDPAGVSEAIQSAHSTMVHRAEAEERSLRTNTPMRTAWRAMHATVDAALFLPGRVHLAHVGNGRIYRMRGANLERLMVENTSKDEWRKTWPNASDEDLEKVSAFPNIILRAIGMRNRDLEIDRLEIETQPADIFLLCSDGLFDFLSDDAIAELLLRMRAEGPAGAARTLVEAALLAPLEQRPARDNITAVIHCVGVDGL